MVRASSIPKPRGFKPYIYREVEEFHLERLRRFLRLLYEEYRSELHLRALLVELVLEEPLELVRKSYPKIEKGIFPEWGLETYRKIQNDIKESFRIMVVETHKPEGYFLGREDLSLCIIDWPGAGRVFDVGRWRVHLPDERSVVRQVLQNVAVDLTCLREDALRSCEECKRFFIQADARPARFCTQRCRVAAVHRRTREKNSKRRK